MLDFIDLSKLGLDPLKVVAIVFAATMLKSIDRKNKFKRGYVLFPFVAAMAICAIETPWVWGKWLMDSFVNAAVAAFLYNIYAKMIRPPRIK